MGAGLWQSQVHNATRMLNFARLYDSDKIAKKMTREYIKENWRVIGIYFEGRMEGSRHCFSLESGGDIPKEDQKNLPSINQSTECCPRNEKLKHLSSK